MGDAVGDKGGPALADGLHQLFRGAACVNVDKIIILDQRRGVPPDEDFLFHVECGLGTDVGLRRGKGRGQGGGAAMDLVEPAHLVERIQVPADGGLRGA